MEGKSHDLLCWAKDMTREREREKKSLAELGTTITVIIRWWVKTPKTHD